MQIAIGVGGAIVEHVFGATLGVFAQLFIKINALPLGNYFRLFFGQTAAHGEVCFWQVKGRGIIAGFGFRHCCSFHKRFERCLAKVC